MARPREYGKRVAMGLRLPEETHARLVAAAEDRDLPANRLIEKAIVEYLDRLRPIDEILP